MSLPPDPFMTARQIRAVRILVDWVNDLTDEEVHHLAKEADVPYSADEIRDRVSAGMLKLTRTPKRGR